MNDSAQRALDDLSLGRLGLLYFLYGKDWETLAPGHPTANPVPAATDEERIERLKALVVARDRLARAMNTVCHMLGAQRDEVLRHIYSMLRNLERLFEKMDWSRFHPNMFGILCTAMYDIYEEYYPALEAAGRVLKEEAEIAAAETLPHDAVNNQQRVNPKSIVLPQKQAEVLKILQALPPGEARTGKQIIAQMNDGTEQSTLTSSIIPGLRKAGIKVLSNPGAGYSLEQ